MDRDSAENTIYEALLPLERFGLLLEGGNFKDATVNPFDVGVVTSALVGHAHGQLDALVGNFNVGKKGAPPIRLADRCHNKKT